MGVPNTTAVIKLGLYESLIQVGEGLQVRLMEVSIQQAQLVLSRIASVFNICVPLQYEWALM